VACVPLPKGLQEEIKKEKGLYPSVCMGSSQDRVVVNFNPDKFEFNLTDKINTYYRDIH